VTDAALAWAATVTDRPVTGSTRLTGGMTSTMLRLSHASGDDTVLRLMTEEPWRRHGAELSRREAETQVLLADGPVPAPRSLALDADGEHADTAAHLMTYLPGHLDHERTDDAFLTALARLLAEIHDVRSVTWPRTFQSWAYEAKWIVPEWSARPEVWQRAFDVLAAGDPDYEPCFLHRDFGPHNVLWDGGHLSGVVDWVETSTGPAWLDVAHCASNLARRHGTEVAARFAAAYVAETGRQPAPYWDVLDVVGFLPSPGSELWFGVDGMRRLEAHLARVLAAPE
jgi:aminoglycoside phosphotransferase (APT) family kinase protein